MESVKRAPVKQQPAKQETAKRAPVKQQSAKQETSKQAPVVNKAPMEQAQVVKKAPIEQAPVKQKENTEKKISFKNFSQCLGIIHHGDTSQYASIAISWEFVITHMNKECKFKNAYEFYIYLQSKHDSVENIHKWHYMYMLQEINKARVMSEQFHINSNTLIYSLRSYMLIHNCTNMKQLKSMLEYSLRKIDIYDEKHNILYNKLSRRDWLVMSRYICDLLEIVDEYNTQPYDLFNIESMKSQKLEQALCLHK